MSDRNRIVTPNTDPDRFTDGEKVLFGQGRCSHQSGSGDPRSPLHCGKPSKPGASFGNCADHERRMLEDHWPDGSPRR